MIRTTLLRSRAGIGRRGPTFNQKHSTELHLKIPFLALALLALSSLAPSALARTCEVNISGSDQMKFDKGEIALGADCTQVKLTLVHSGKMAAKVMGHNWVLTRTEDFQAVANDGMRAGLADAYLPKGDARVLAHTPVIGGGETASITFSTKALKKGGAYTFFCSFPGHWAIMKGTLKFG